MALTLARKKLVQACLVNSSSFGFISTSTIQTPVLVNNGFGRSLVLDGLCKYFWFSNLRCFCAGSIVPEKLCWEGTSREVLLRCVIVSAEKSNCAKLIKPDTMIFNLVLDGCVRFGSPLKGQHIMEIMSQTGVIADAHTIVVMAQIHEMNSQRHELKKFKDYIDRVSAPFLQHYRQFYDNLLSLYFKFDDIDAASELVLDMNRYRDSLPDKNLMKGSQKLCLVPIGSPNMSL